MRRRVLVAALVAATGCDPLLSEPQGPSLWFEEPVPEVWRSTEPVPFAVRFDDCAQVEAVRLLVAGREIYSQPDTAFHGSDGGAGGLHRFELPLAVLIDEVGLEDTTILASARCATSGRTALTEPRALRLQPFAHAIELLEDERAPLAADGDLLLVASDGRLHLYDLRREEGHSAPAPGPGTQPFLAGGRAYAFVPCAGPGCAAPAGHLVRLDATLRPSAWLRVPCAPGAVMRGPGPDQVGIVTDCGELQWLLANPGLTDVLVGARPGRLVHAPQVHRGRLGLLAATPDDHLVYVEVDGSGAVRERPLPATAAPGAQLALGMAAGWLSITDPDARVRRDYDLGTGELLRTADAAAARYLAFQFAGPPGDQALVMATARQLHRVDLDDTRAAVFDDEAVAVLPLDAERAVRRISRSWEEARLDGTRATVFAVPAYWYESNTRLATGARWLYLTVEVGRRRYLASVETPR